MPEERATVGLMEPDLRGAVGDGTNGVRKNQNPRGAHIVLNKNEEKDAQTICG